MPRKLLLIAPLGIALLVAACGGGDEEGAAPTATPRPTATATALPADTPTPSPVPSTPTATPTPATTLADRGKTLSARNGCAACHSADGSASVGPTWKGLFGKEETLTDGTAIQVDEDYLRESIVDPDAKVVKGFPPGIMPPDFGEKLSEEDIQAIIEYIKALE